MAVSDAYNFRQVDAQVSTAGVVSEEQLGELKTEGYEAVINLLPSHSEYAVANEPDIVLSQGLGFTYIPVDFEAPTRDDYAEFEKAMQANAGRKLMLHCAANYRVSAFYSIYAVKNLGWTRQQAHDFMGDIWSLDEYPVWKTFVAGMLEES